MLMHAENSSLQNSSAQRRTDPVLPGTGVPPTASQTTALPHQCRKYLAKNCQDCHHTLPRPPNLPATHLPTSLTRAHSPATHTTRSSRDSYYKITEISITEPFDESTYREGNLLDLL